MKRYTNAMAWGVCALLALALLAPGARAQFGTDDPYAVTQDISSYYTTGTACSASKAGSNGALTISTQPDTPRTLMVTTYDYYCPSTNTTNLTYTLTVRGLNQFGESVAEVFKKTSDTVTHGNNACTSRFYGKVAFATVASAAITGIGGNDASHDTVRLYMGDKVGFSTPIRVSGDVFKANLATGSTFPQALSALTVSAALNIKYATIEIPKLTTTENPRLQLWIKPSRPPSKSLTRYGATTTDLE